MRISVFGLGYVGSVSAACFAELGHEVIGVDVSEQKLDIIRRGMSPIVEPGLAELIDGAVGSGALTVTRDPEEAVRSSDVSLVCVGTPSQRNGSLDISAVEKVFLEIGEALGRKDGYHLVVLRSTVLPGTARGFLLPILEGHSSKSAGEDFGFASNPEFLREGSAVKDFFDPSFTLVGSFDEDSGRLVEELYSKVDAPVVHTGIEVAEMMKYVSNAFHALKVSFANEVGDLAKAHGIDGREVMEIFSMDRKLNISPAYLRPGFAFGGSCLPKDTRALAYRAKELDRDAPLLNAILPSNERHISRAIEMVERLGRRKVGVLGLSFKANTDDVRESPIVPLVETLVGRGYEVAVFDDQVQVARLMGSNKAFLEELPHVASLLRSSKEEVLEESEVVVVANPSPAFRDVAGLIREGQHLIDLVGVPADGERKGGYEGICW